MIAQGATSNHDESGLIDRVHTGVSRLLHPLLRAWLGFWCRPNVHGVDQIPDNLPVCYVLTNPAHTDIALLDSVTQRSGRQNPFVDPANCWADADVQEAMLRAQLELQAGGAAAR